MEQSADYDALATAMVVLLAERQAQGLRRADVVDHLGVTHQHVSRIERGLNLTFDIVTRYAALVGLEVEVRVIRVIPPEGTDHA